MNDYNDGTGTSPAELSCLDNLEDLYDYYKRLCNRVELHRCKRGGCLTETFKTVKDKEGKDVKITEHQCRFNFPFNLNGFKKEFNEETKELQGIEPYGLEETDTLANPLVYGASYKKRNQHGGFEETKLELLRNHPNMNNHIPEILILWGG